MLRTIKKLLGIKDSVPKEPAPKVVNRRPEPPRIVPVQASPRPPLARSVSARSGSGDTTPKFETGSDGRGSYVVINETNGSPVVTVAPPPLVSGGGGDFGGGGATGTWAREAAAVTNTGSESPAPVAVTVEAAAPPAPAPAPVSYDPPPAPPPAAASYDPAPAPAPTFDAGSFITLASISPDARSRKSARIHSIRKDI